MYSRPFNDQHQTPKNYGGTLYQAEQRPSPENDTPEKSDDACQNCTMQKNTEKMPLFGKNHGSQLDTEDLLLLGLVILLMANKDQNDIIMIIALLFAVGIF